MTVHSGEERIIWEAESQNVAALATSRATGGRLKLRYRLTTHYLYYERGGIAGTKQEQVPLIDIQDVDLRQSLLQRTRGVGTVMVHITRRSGIHETAVLDSVAEPEQVRDLINRTVHLVRTTAHQRQHAEQRDLRVHRFEDPTPVLPMGQPGPAAEVEPGQPAPPSDQVVALLAQLGELRAAGVLTEEEFQAKKAELLRRL